MKTTAKDLRFHSKRVLDAVERGEEVIITYRGKARAKIMPIEQEEEEINPEMPGLFGIWKDNEKVSDAGQYVRELRKGRF